VCKEEFVTRIELTRAQPGGLRGLKPPLSQVKVEKKDKKL